MEGTHSPLSEQILRLRPEYKGLTFRYCKTVKPLGGCEEYSTIEHPQTKDFADELVKLGFVCKVYDKRHKPHVMDEKFGLARVTYKGVWPFKKQLIEFVALEENHDKLMQASMKCFSEAHYDFTEM